VKWAPDCPSFEELEGKEKRNLGGETERDSSSPILRGAPREKSKFWKENPERGVIKGFEKKPQGGGQTI